MREIILEVGRSEGGLSAEKFLKNRGFSRRLVTKLKHSGGITRGGAVLRCIDPVSEGERIRVVLEDFGTMDPNFEIKAAVSYEDEDAVVFDKPPQLPVHPSIRHHNDTLANVYMALYPNSVFRPVNRLDKNTSGLCLCAKNGFSAPLLGKSVSKVYYAVVDGDIRGAGEIGAPIGRASGSIIKREVRTDGQTAVTLYEPILRKNGRTLLRIILKTGRTHQIRVHFAYLGFPLCGDELYGGDCSAIERQALHCGQLSFTRPISGERITVKSDLPDDIRRLIE